MTGDKFERFKKLNSNSKKFSVFIQTDKSVYKPSDIVKFRIFILDSDTKIFKFDNIEVFITDGADNRVKQYNDPAKGFNKGVYQNELQLSDLPVMGTWKINVLVNGGDKVVKTFDVDEYVLPKFEVTLDANPDANFKEGIIRATVKAKYTFGKIAKGNATVTAEVDSPRYWYWRGSPEPSKKVSKTVAVDGKKFVEFDVKKELEMSEDSYRRHVKLFATFTEELSGKEANATARVEVHKTPHKMELTTSASKVKPGLPFKVTASVKFHDKDFPVTDKYNPVNYTVTYYYVIPKKCQRKIYPPWRPYHIARLAGEGESTTESGIDEETKTTTEEITTTTTVKYEEYDCREEKSYNKQTNVSLKNGIAELDIDIPKNITHLRVDVGQDYFFC